jgi:hypothetical protein
MGDMERKIAALTPWTAGDGGPNLGNYCAAMDRLALAREWIARDGCEDDCMVYRATPQPCTCGRAALLAALDGPK